jgi:hypothetical protein
VRVAVGNFVRAISKLLFAGGSRDGHFGMNRSASNAPQGYRNASLLAIDTPASTSAPTPPHRHADT